MSFLDAVVIKTIKFRYENKAFYLKRKLQIIAIIACLSAAIFTYTSFDNLRIENIRITNVTVQDFKPGFVSDSKANVTIDLDTDSIVEKLKVVILFKDKDGQSYKTDKIIDLTPNPVFFKNKASFDLPEKIKSIKDLKIKLILNSQEKEFTPEVLKID